VLTAVSTYSTECVRRERGKGVGNVSRRGGSGKRVSLPIAIKDGVLNKTSPESDIFKPLLRPNLKRDCGFSSSDLLEGVGARRRSSW